MEKFLFLSNIDYLQSISKVRKIKNHKKIINYSYFLIIGNFWENSLEIESGKKSRRKDPTIWGYVADLESLELKLKNENEFTRFLPDKGWNSENFEKALQSKFSYYFLNFFVTFLRIFQTVNGRTIFIQEFSYPSNIPYWDRKTEKI